MKDVYNQSRNGADGFYRHSLVRYFQYSNGVQEVAEAGGCHWLLDILATELPNKMRKAGETLATIKVTVKGGKAVIHGLGSGDVKFYAKRIDYTDMPAGVWDFLICDEGERFALILVSEY